MPIAGRQIRNAVPTTIEAGTHQVDGNPNQRLIVGNYGQPNVNRHRQNQKTIRPLPDAVVTEVHTKEEKGSDVNLAAHLLNDAWSNHFSEALVITNDTDLITPIEMVTVERKLTVTVANPQIKSGTAPGLQAVASHVRHVNRGMLARSQFPDPVIRPNGNPVNKPPNW